MSWSKVALSENVGYPNMIISIEKKMIKDDMQVDLAPLLDRHMYFPYDNQMVISLQVGRQKKSPYIVD